MAFSYNKMLSVIDAKKFHFKKNIQKNKDFPNTTISRIFEILDEAKNRLTMPTSFRMVDYTNHKIYKSESPGVESWCYPSNSEI